MRKENKEHRFRHNFKIKADSTQLFNEFRPQVHFTPEKNG
jgi:sucrose-6-phosphate hydrolase SacC (GH32 family)